MLGQESNANTVGYNTAVKQTIYAVEDDSDISRLVRHHLESAGYGVRSFPTAAGVITEAEKQPPAMFLLDIMLPGGDGLELCRKIRQTPALAMIPVIFLTAKTTESDKVIGLELGADDYIPKPFSPRELVVRVRTVLRRASGDSSSEVIRVGDLTLDRARYQVNLPDRTVALTTTEFELLATMMSQPGRIFSRAQLLKAVRGVAFESYERAIDSHIRNLRRKLEPGEYIVTVHGVGYKFAP